ncbi:hypothetical protein ACOME3_007829 [Neoechinorhynchus agilis]
MKSSNAIPDPNKILRIPSNVRVPRYRVKTGDKIEGVVVWASQSNLFQEVHLQLKKNTRSFIKLCDEMNEHYHNGVDQKMYVNWNPHFSHFAVQVKGEWYRCEPMAQNKVLLIDYGDEVSIDDISIICPLDIRFMFLPVQLVQCELVDFQAKVDDDISAIVFKIGKDGKIMLAHAESPLDSGFDRAEIIGALDDQDDSNFAPYSVHNLIPFLKSVPVFGFHDDMLLWNRPEKQKKQYAIITHVDTNEQEFHFYAQIFGNIESHMKRLFQLNQFDPEHFEIIPKTAALSKMKCWAMDGDDEFLRVTVQRIFTDGTYRVFAVDHGFSFTTETLLALNQSVELPIKPLATKCTLCGILDRLKPNEIADFKRFVSEEGQPKVLEVVQMSSSPLHSDTQVLLIRDHAGVDHYSAVFGLKPHHTKAANDGESTVIQQGSTVSQEWIDELHKNQPPVREQISHKSTSVPVLVAAGQHHYVSEESIPLFKWIPVEVLSVNGADSLYVTFPFGWDANDYAGQYGEHEMTRRIHKTGNLYCLYREMGRVLNSCIPKRIDITVSIGELVAFKSYADEWFRVQVIDFNDQKEIIELEIFFVDIARRINCPIDCLYKLPEQFSWQPFHAVLLRLDCRYRELDPNPKYLTQIIGKGKRLFYAMKVAKPDYFELCETKADGSTVFITDLLC